MTPMRALTILIVPLLITIFVVITVSSSMRESATYDETSHLVSGYSYLRWNDYRMNSEHPPLLKKWAALPLLGLQIWPDSVYQPTLSSDPASITLQALQSVWAQGLASTDMQWFFSHYMLYGARDKALRRTGATNPLQIPTNAALSPPDFCNNADQILFWGRLPMILLATLLAFMIFLWSRNLFGFAGGIISLALFCLDPNFIAHSGLVTTDVGTALFSLGSMYFLWKTCQRPCPRYVGLTSLFTGLAVATKFSAVLLMPMFVVVLAIWTARSDRALRPRRMAMSAGMILIIAISAWILLWGSYGFRFSAAANPELAATTEQIAAQNNPFVLPANHIPGYFPLESTIRRSAVMKSLMTSETPGVTEDVIQQMMATTSVPLTGRLMLFARDWHLIPEAYLYGFAFAEMKSQFRSSYLLGSFSQTGWWYYFPVAILLKTPPITLLAILAALFLACFRRRVPPLTLAFLLVPVTIFLAASMTSHLNIGHRHILPIYPFLFVLCGCLGPLWQTGPRRIRMVVAGAAIMLLILNTQFVFTMTERPTRVYPDYLSYFNEFAGGPRHGYESLADSNLDWGQGLKELKEWMNRHPVHEPFYLSYFGTADPRYYGISCLNMPGGYLFAPTITLDQISFPAYFAISATTLAGVYQSPDMVAFIKTLTQESTLVDTVGHSIFIYHHN